MRTWVPVLGYLTLYWPPHFGGGASSQSPAVPLTVLPHLPPPPAAPCPQAKVIVFVSTCKQVRFLHEAFRKLRPGVPLRALHGRMNQYKRMGGEWGALAGGA